PGPDGGRRVLDGRRAEHAGVAIRAAGGVPDLANTPDLALEARGASPELGAERLEVVLPPSLREPEHEPPRRELVDHRRLLRDQHLVPVPQLQNRGREPDPLGHPRDPGKRREWVPRVVVRLVDGAEHGEPRLVGEAGPHGRPGPRPSLWSLA